jgi:Zn-dependent protease
MNNRRFDTRTLIFIAILLFIGPGMALMRGGFSGMMDWFMSTLTMLPAIIVGLSFHEYAHAKVADLCGDPTPRYMGRVTIDPRAHIDPMGMVALIFIHFGWGRPVMYNPNNLKNGRAGRIMIGLAGVAMNFVVALVFTLIIKVLYMISAEFFLTGFGNVVLQVLYSVIVINVSLMLFNLIPCPPLDGFGVICDIFNLYNTKFYWFVSQNSMMLLMMLILFDVPELLLTRPLNLIVNMLLSII